MQFKPVLFKGQQYTHFTSLSPTPVVFKLVRKMQILRPNPDLLNLGVWIQQPLYFQAPKVIVLYAQVSDPLSLDHCS